MVRMCACVHRLLHHREPIGNLSRRLSAVARMRPRMITDVPALVDQRYESGLIDNPPRLLSCRRDILPDHKQGRTPAFGRNQIDLILEVDVIVHPVRPRPRPIVFERCLPRRYACRRLIRRKRDHNLSSLTTRENQIAGCRVIRTRCNRRTVDRRQRILDRPQVNNVGHIFVEQRGKRATADTKGVVVSDNALG